MQKDDAGGGSSERGGGAAFVIGLAVAHALILGLMLSRRFDPLFNDAAHRLGPGTDFKAYWAAGRGVVTGHGAYGHGPGFGFRYHPLFAAIVGVATSNHTVEAAFAAWVVVQEAAFFAVWRALHRLLPRREFEAASVLLVFFSPYYLEAYMGNASFVAGASLLAVLLLDVRGRALVASLVLAAGIIVKPIGLVLLPWQVLRGRWRHAALVVLIVVGSAVPFFICDPGSLGTLLDVNVRTMPHWFVHGGNHGLHALVVDLCVRLAGLAPAEVTSLDDLPRTGAVFVTWFPFCLTALSLAAAWRVRGNPWLCAFLLFSTYLLGFKDVWEHSYSFAFLPLLCAHLSRAVSPRLVLLAAAWTALPTAFVFYDVAGHADPEPAWSFGISVLHHATKAAPLLVLYVVAVVDAFAGSAEDFVTGR